MSVVQIKFRYSDGLRILKHSLFQDSWRLDVCCDFCWIVGASRWRRIRARLQINKAKIQQMHRSETCRSHTYKDPAQLVFRINISDSQKDMKLQWILETIQNNSYLSSRVSWMKFSTIPYINQLVMPKAHRPRKVMRKKNAYIHKA